MASLLNPKSAIQNPKSGFSPGRACTVHFLMAMSAIANAPFNDDELARSQDFYRDAMELMQKHKLPFLVGGAYAFARYTGIERHTKDFDVFIRRDDFDRAKTIFTREGYNAELTFPHWIGKVFKGDDFVDLIFSAGNGVARVDDRWFTHAVAATIFGLEVQLIPAEEMIWSKGLIMERERFDGADVAHVIRAVGEKLDWRRLLERYSDYWRALYSHLILFGFIYPSDRNTIPKWVMEELAERLDHEQRKAPPHEKVCYGTIISRQQYLTDVNEWGYKDARLQPAGNMTADEIAQWTEGIAVDGA
jgi:catechol 2,3-dioxygenase-like lactoylglutathione lyase family enzyme